MWCAPEYRPVRSERTAIWPVTRSSADRGTTGSRALYSAPAGRAALNDSAAGRSLVWRPFDVERRPELPVHDRDGSRSGRDDRAAGSTVRWTRREDLG